MTDTGAEPIHDDRRVQLLRASGRPAQHWKNGQGITWQVAASPAGAGLDTFDWRLSIAEISQDGPFSAFPGVDRSIAVIDGAGMILTVDGVEHTLAPYFVHTFAGDSVTSCRLAGSTTLDLNLMTARQHFRGRLEFATVAGELMISATVVLVLRGRLSIAGPAGESCLTALDAVLLSDATVVRAEHALIAVVTVTPVGVADIADRAAAAG